MSGGNTRRGRLQKSNQAKLQNWKKELEFQTFLLKLETSSCSLIQTAEYCRELTVDLNTELWSHYAKRIEYLDMAMDLIGPDSDAPVSYYLSIQNVYRAVEIGADIFCKKIKGLALRYEEFEKIKELAELALDDKVERIAKEDPVGIEAKMEHAMAKAKEIKNEFDSLKTEWNAVKDELNNGIDGCTQLVNLRLQDLTLQELEAGEE